MKISMFTNTYLPHVGGVARSISTFYEDLTAAGQQVQVIAPTFPAVDDDEWPDVVRVPAIQNFNGSDFSVKLPLAGAISDAIDAFSPDIIHSHHPFLLGDSAVRIARQFDLPVVFTHHTRYEEYTHYVPLDSATMKRFVSDLATRYANLCDRVIAPSAGIKKLLVDRGVQSAVEVLPSGVDIDHFSSGSGERFRRRHDISPDAAVIGHVGRLAREKNLPYLAGAVARVVHAYPETVFLVAGRGDAEDEIRSIFRDSGAEQSLIMVGNTGGSELADCYAAMDIFAFASHSETQGLVLAEAMAASIPCVALEATGVDDVMQDGVNGLVLAADATETQFAAAILSLLRDRQLRRAMGNGCAQTVQPFSRQNCCRQLIELYRSILDRTSEPARGETDSLDALLMSIKAEWDLLQGKTGAALNSIVGE